MNKQTLATLTVATITAWGSLQAQTTLSGNHIVTGNLDVGNSSTKGSLKVTAPTGTTTAPAVSVSGDGGVIFSGTFGSGSLPTASEGAKFIWYPKKAALRAGLVSGSEWSDANIGNYSVALGSGCRATDSGAVALGYYSAANGLGAAALGSGAATGSGAFAAGQAVQANGEGATAIGGGGETMALADYATAIGVSVYAYGVGASVFGSGANATGNWSTAIGGYAGGDNSTAIRGTSTGNYSIAAGEGTNASSAYSLTTGRYNVIEGSSSSWVATDPLFVVGNGANSSNTHNAFTVYKNGKIKMDKQGDISMGEFAQ